MPRLHSIHNKQYPFIASWLLGCLLIVFTTAPGHAQTWVATGAPGFSAGTAWFTSIAIDHSGTPYVAYQDYGNGQKATVKKYNGTSWVTVGTAGFTGWIAYYLSIATDTGGTPYIAFEDYNNSYKASVMKFNGTSWVYVGTAGFSAGTASYTSIAFDKNGTPYVAYEDYGNGKKATVMKYNGTNWVNVGAPGFSDSTVNYTNIAIDTGGAPYVVYEDYAHSQKATVMKYNGTSWAALSSPGISAGSCSYTSMVVKTDTPYVLFSDNANSQKATVLKYNGSSWVGVGSPGFSAGGTAYTSLAISSTGTPYAAYYDAAYSGHATVMKYNGAAWVTVGLQGFSDSTATYTSIAINSGGIPYVAYSDYSDTQKVTVMTLDTALAPISGTKTVCVGFTTSLSDATPGGIWSSHNTAIATIGSTGIVTGITPGTGKISYTVSGNSASVLVTVYPLPAAGSITGPSAMCADSGVALTDATAGGVWSSSNTAIATVNGTGGVTGHAGGTVTISYSVTNLCGSDYATHIITLNPLPSPGIITGTTSLCTSSTASLSDTVTGGVWSSSNTTIATIGSTGIVSGHTAGTATISYGMTNGCGTSYAVRTVTVEVLPVVGGVTGLSSVCAGATISLTDGTTGGTWSSSNTAIATVSGTGAVTGHSGGTVTISYTVTNSCGPVYATHTVTVQPLPDPGIITGPDSVCTASTITLTDAVTGGTWSSSNTAAATIGSTGIVNGITTGTTTISYTVTNSCGPSSAIKVITVDHAPFAGSITGASILCADSSTTLTDTTASNAGIWSSGNAAIATVSGTGVVSGHSGGTVTISYAVTNNCGTVFATHIVTVQPLPSAGAITGGNSVCPSGTVTLTDIVTGGTWSSSNSGIASVSSTGIVTGHILGTATISYTLTNGCGTAAATKLITVSSSPGTGIITGADTVCASLTATVSDTVSGGIWSSSNTAVATIGSTGIITGHSGGTATISYAVTNSCGTAAATHIVTVSPLPNPGNITGTDTVCKSSTAILGETIPGGVWSSANTSIATIDSTGMVSGISGGTVAISYALSNSCGTAFATRAITVGLLPDAGSIKGADTVCTSATITLSDTITGGVWSSSNTGIATIDSAGMVSGISAGTVTVSYTSTTRCGTTTATHPVTIHACLSNTQNIGKLVIFPDPNRGRFTVILFTMLPENATVTISDMLGKKMKEFYATTNTDIPVQLNVPPGMYFITAVAGSETVSAKVMVR